MIFCYALTKYLHMIFFIYQMIDVNKQLHPNQARQLLNNILKIGTVYFTRHAREEMASDGLTEGDIFTVLRRGRIFPGEFERNSWRYRVCLEKDWSVVAFRTEDAAVVVTAWRKAT